MNLAGAGIAHHTYDFAAGGPAHDGIIHKNYTLSFQQMPNGI